MAFPTSSLYFTGQCYKKTPSLGETLEYRDTCVRASNTTFCWPPDGARLCVPNNFAITWSWQFYSVYSTLIPMFNNATVSSFMLNHHFADVYITTDTFSKLASPIQGTTNERRLKLFMRESLVNGTVIVHNGPTVTLVSTQTPTPTSTRYVSSDCIYNCGSPKLSPGQIAGITLGAIWAVVATLLCCRFCKCCRRPKDGKSKAEVQELDAEPVQQPAEVEAIMGSRAHADQLSRVEEARIAEDVEMHGDDPPPKYTP